MESIRILVYVIVISFLIIVGCMIGYTITLVQVLKEHQKDEVTTALVEFFDKNEISVSCPIE